MNYLEVKLKLNREVSDILADVFLENGALSVAIEDAFANTECEISLYDETKHFQIWENVLIIALFKEDNNIDYIVTKSFHQVGIDSKIDYEVNLLKNENWLKKSQSSFESIKITDKLWVVPTWECIKDPLAINIRIDPGLAFGTGEHSTTKLCLNLLYKYIRNNDSVLDYGCGSGILSIASKKLGAKKVVGVDIDNLEIKTSKDNAVLNEEKIDFYLPNDKRINYNYDIVVANILTNSLRILADLLMKYTKGYIILSGILEFQEKEIKEIYSKWFEFENTLYEEGWVCILGRKKL